ncbi:hypothetical protein QZH41_017679 [Actinostola sp. cb2023]|nr:hypothetical protein QZH41_017679 [Actinostola sp. cb2023]
MAVTEEQDTDNQVIGPEVLQDQASDQESIHLSDSPRETVPSDRPVRNRRPPQVFTYSNLGSPAVNWYQANNITAYPNHGGTNFAQPYSNPSAPLYVGSPVSYPYHVGAVQNCSTEKKIGYIIQEIAKVVVIAYQSMKVSKMAPNCEDRSFGNAKCIDEEDGKQPQLKTSMDYVQPRLDKSLEKEFIDSEYLNLSHFRGNESTSVEPEQRVECKEPLKELFKELITPVQQYLTEDEIVIVPEGPLYSVPFAALQDPQTGRFLSETKRIRLAPSLTTLKLLKDCPADYHSKTGALFVGNPHVGEVMFRGEKITFKNLPIAEDEATVLSRVFRAQPALTGIHATKDAVKEKLREGPALIHIAAHGDDSNGQIALAPGISAQSKPIPEEEDYILTMKEVQEIGVRAQLVVLSCCHSGRGEIRAEGVVGMSRAFLAAGARAVVASLWSIDDYVTLEFMASFYKYLRYGDSASLSLKNAMEELRGNRRYSEPKYWAPFFLIGDDVTISKI